MMTSHPIATAWLERVERLASQLSPGARAELLEDLREHLDAALPVEADRSEVQRVLARLGEPEEVVRAAAEGDAPQSTPAASPAPPQPPVGATRVEVVTLVLLVASGLLVAVVPLAVVLWLVGVLLLTLRSRWEGGEVGVGLAVPVLAAIPGLAPLVGLLALRSGGTCTQFDDAEPICTTDPGSDLAGLLYVGVVVVAVVLLVLAVRWLVRRVRGRTLVQ